MRDGAGSMNLREPPASAERRALVVVAGRPGSGKGTQCSRIASALGIVHVSWGDALRQEIDRCTPLGHEVQATLEAGQLVPDHCVFELVGPRLARQRAAVVLLDGFPRTLKQAEALERLQPGAVVLAVLLAVPVATVLERLRSRGRADDRELVLRERLASFDRETIPMLAWYRERGALVSIDANHPQSGVTDALEAVIGQFVAAVPRTAHASPQPVAGRSGAPRGCASTARPPTLAS
jgi:adenylate kinase